MTPFSHGQAVGLIPTRYPGTASSGDPALMLARKTAWEEAGQDYFGLGQRMFATDAGEFALMDLRSLSFNAPEAIDHDA